MYNKEILQEQSYHFAVSGKAFAVITEHFPHLVQKVKTQLLTYKLLHNQTSIRFTSTQKFTLKRNK